MSSGELPMDLRELKALEIAARAKIAFTDGVWLVPSEAVSGCYSVTLGSEPFCPCDDFELRQLPCKHIMAARLAGSREHYGKPTATVTDALPDKPTSNTY